MMSVSQSSGDESISSYAPNLLYEKLWGFLVDYAIKFTAEEKDAQDIVAGVFIKLLNTKRTFPSFADGRAYMYASVRNGCIDYLEKDRKIKKHTAQLSYLASTATDNELLSLHRTAISDEHLQKVIASLPQRDRFFLKCCLNESLSMAEVAAQTGYTVKGAYNKKSLLLQYLRNELKKYRY